MWQETYSCHSHFPIVTDILDLQNLIFWPDFFFVWQEMMLQENYSEIRSFMVMTWMSFLWQENILATYNLFLRQEFYFVIGSFWNSLILAKESVQKFNSVLFCSRLIFETNCENSYSNFLRGTKISHQPVCHVGRDNPTLVLLYPFVYPLVFQYI